MHDCAFISNHNSTLLTFVEHCCILINNADGNINLWKWAELSAQEQVITVLIINKVSFLPGVRIDLISLFLTSGWRFRELHSPSLQILSVQQQSCCLPTSVQLCETASQKLGRGKTLCIITQCRCEMSTHQRHCCNFYGQLSKPKEKSFDSEISRNDGPHMSWRYWNYFHQYLGFFFFFIKKTRDMICSDANVWHRIISGLKIAFLFPSESDKAFFSNTLHFFLRHTAYCMSVDSPFWILKPVFCPRCVNSDEIVS